MSLIPGFLRTTDHPDNFEELIGRSEISKDKVQEVEDKLGFELRERFDTIEKTKELQETPFSSFKGRGSAVLPEDGEVHLRYKQQPDLAALARSGVYSVFLEDAEDMVDGLPTDDPFESFTYLEFVASVAQESVLRTDFDRWEEDDFLESKDLKERKEAEAVEAVLEGSVEERSRDWLEMEEEELMENEDEIRDYEALMQVRKFDNLDSLYEKHRKSELLEQEGVRGTKKKRRDFEKAVDAYQSGRGVIVARHAARLYLDKEGFLVHPDEELKPADFLNPSQELFDRTIDYINRLEDAFEESPGERVEISTED